MTVADWLLVAGMVPATYVAYWMLAGLVYAIPQHGKRATVTLSVGGPYILLAFALTVAGIVGAVLSIVS